MNKCVKLLPFPSGSFKFSVEKTVKQTPPINYSNYNQTLKYGNYF